MRKRLESKVNIWEKGSKSTDHEVKINIGFLIEDKKKTAEGHDVTHSTNDDITHLARLTTCRVSDKGK
jgi:hypothetical protein